MCCRWAVCLRAASLRAPRRLSGSGSRAQDRCREVPMLSIGVLSLTPFVCLRNRDRARSATLNPLNQQRPESDARWRITMATTTSQSFAAAHARKQIESTGDRYASKVLGRDEEAAALIESVVQA